MSPRPPECSCNAIGPSNDFGFGSVKSIIGTPFNREIYRFPTFTRYSFHSSRRTTISFSGEGQTIHCAAVAVNAAGMLAERAIDFKLQALRYVRLCPA